MEFQGFSVVFLRTLIRIRLVRAISGAFQRFSRVYRAYQWVSRIFSKFKGIQGVSGYLKLFLGVS